MPKTTEKADLKPALDLTLKPSSYQPSKAEMEEEFVIAGIDYNSGARYLYAPVQYQARCGLSGGM